MSVLVCTVGASWAVLPEVVSFLDLGFRPGLFDRHFLRRELEQERADLGPVDLVLTVTSDSEDALKATAQAAQWWDLTGRPPANLRLYSISRTGHLNRPQENLFMREAIYRLVLAARTEARRRSTELVLSLAGGRKTMSADLQRAGGLFGSEALLHLVADQEAEQGLRTLLPETLAHGLVPQEVVNGLGPVRLGRLEASEVLEIRSLDPSRFPLEAKKGPNGRILTVDLAEPTLLEEVEKTLAESRSIVRNFFFETTSEEPYENFRGLYRLRPERIKDLRGRPIGADPARAEEDLAWLRRLPKADLHCHLGGVLDSAGLVRVSQAVLKELAPDRRKALQWAVREVHGLLCQAVKVRIDDQPLKETLDQLAKRFDFPGHLILAAFLAGFVVRLGELDELTFGPYGREPAYIGLGLDKYTLLGDLQGSNLLQTRAALAETVRYLYEQACADNVLYLELRCSPRNYTTGGLGFEQVLETIRETIREEWERRTAQNGSACQIKLVLIATRHKSTEDIREHIDLGVKYAQRSRPDQPAGVVGFDLAGDEAAGRPEELRRLFLPVFDQCLRVTVHAGEAAEVSSVWEAVYHLNADRIGHGLNLAANEPLLTRFRDRGTAVELCPSSNFQTLGFRDYWLDSTCDRPIYPLRFYLDQGLEICLNTDNPGFSRTSLSREFLKAARMVEGGLSRWEILTLVRLGFKNAFLPRPDLSALLKQVDQEVFNLMSE